MWHPLPPPFCMATVILCLQGAASSRANSTGTGGPAPAAWLWPQLAKGEMAGGPALGHTHTSSLARSPPCCRVKAPSAQRGGHRISTSSPDSRGMAPDSGEVQGAPAATVEVNVRLQRKSHRAEQGTIVLLDECCFWNSIMWSFTHHVCRCLTHDLDLLYYGLILPVCKVTSILITVLTGIQLLARCMKSYQRQRESRKELPESLPSVVWGCSECAICLQAYEPGERLKWLSCSHAFHGKCIDLWHRVQPRSKTCPLCLRSVTAVVLIPLGAHNNKRE